MDASLLIANLVTVERTAGKIGDQQARDFVIQAQDCILNMQRDNLELRRENHLLRLRLEASRADGGRLGGISGTAAPFAFPATA
jgi:hypothetical protein